MNQTEETTSTATKTGSRPDAVDNARLRIFSGALTGAGVLFVTVLVSAVTSTETDHGLDGPITLALFMLAGAIPLLAGCFVVTFIDGLLVLKTMSMILGGLGIFIAFGAILWHLNHIALSIYIGAIVLVIIVGAAEDHFSK